MTERVTCKRCGASILPETAKRLRGCCAHCGRVPWLLYYGIVGFGKFCEWIDPFMKRLLRIREPDYALFQDLARLMTIPARSLQTLQDAPDEAKENQFLDLLEKHSLGAMHDLRDAPEDVINALKPCWPRPLFTTWQQIEADLRRLDPAPVEAVLRVVHAHLNREDFVPRMFATTHDFFVTAFVPRQRREEFDARLERSANDAGLLEFCSDGFVEANE